MFEISNSMENNHSVQAKVEKNSVVTMIVRFASVRLVFILYC